ncbi:MAG TPA: dienelactone hydrolase family protein [Azospirillaceae bacterium]|nr:dienelactone hydrolase family protein [Azospirillaceae bacterium]
MAIDPRIIALYDEYTHAPLDRRVFLDRLARLAGGAAAAAALLPVLEPNHALARTVPPDDPSIRAERAAVPAGDGQLPGYLAVPTKAERSGAVVVVHENRGLNPHIEDVARRLAKAGFIGFAPDLLAQLGGTPKDADEARGMFARLDARRVQSDLKAAIRFLETHPASNGKVGAVGFCWGGGTVARLATDAPDLDAAIVFYGPAPDSEAVGGIQAPLLLHYASLDTRINAGLPAFESALQAAGKRYRLHMYEGVNHAFHNDTGGERYNAEAAGLAWDRTLAFLRETLA